METDLATEQGWARYNLAQYVDKDVGSCSALQFGRYSLLCMACQSQSKKIQAFPRCQGTPSQQISFPHCLRASEQKRQAKRQASAAKVSWAAHLSQIHH